MHTDTSLLAPPLFPQTVTPATPQCHPRIQTEISSTHWSVLRTLLLPLRSRIEKRLYGSVCHPVDSQAIAFPACTPVGLPKASNVQRPPANAPPRGLHGRFWNIWCTSCFQPLPPERPVCSADPDIGQCPMEAPCRGLRTIPRPPRRSESRCRSGGRSHVVTAPVRHHGCASD